MKSKVISYIMPTYNKRNLEFTHGKGVYYLHLRIEPFPKYYHTKSFTRPKI